MDKELKDRLHTLHIELMELKEMIIAQVGTGITLMHIVMGMVKEENIDMELIKSYFKAITPIILKHKELLEMKVLLVQAEDIIRKKQKDME